MTEQTPAEGLRQATDQATNEYLGGLVDQALAPIQSDLAATTTTLRDTQQALADAQAALARTQASLDTANGANTALTAEVARLTARVKELEAQVKPPTVPPVPVNPDDERPTGPGYVALESLGVGRDLVAALGKLATSTTPVKLTLPDGEPLTGPRWATGGGVFNVPGKVIGLVAAKNKPATIGFPAGFTRYTTGVTTTNPYHTVMATAGTFEEWSYVQLVGNAGQQHGGAKIQNEKKAPLVRGFRIVDGAPGNYWSNPEETFGLNLYRCLLGAAVVDFGADGRGNMASAVGFNSTNSIVIDGMKVRGTPYGMPTIWKGRDADIWGLDVEGAHIGFNLEQVGGVIRFYAPRMFPFRGIYTEGRGKGTDNSKSGMHLTFQSNDPAYLAELHVYDPIVDAGLRNNGLCIMSSTLYTSPGPGTAQLQDWKKIHVYQGGQEIPVVDVGKNSTDPLRGTKDPHNAYLYR